MRISRPLLIIFFASLALPEYGESFQILSRKQFAAIRHLRTNTALFATPADVLEQAAETVATSQPAVNPKDIYLQGLALIADASGGADAQTETAFISSRMAESIAVLDGSGIVDPVAAAVAVSTPVSDMTTDIPSTVSAQASESKAIFIDAVGDNQVNNVGASESLSNTFKPTQILESTAVLPQTEVPSTPNVASIPLQSSVSSTDSLIPTYAESASKLPINVPPLQVPDTIISDAASTVSQSPPPALSTDFSTLISADSISQINNVLTSVQIPEAAVTATTSNSLSEITPTLTEKVAQITNFVDAPSTPNVASIPLQSSVSSTDSLIPTYAESASKLPINVPPLQVPDTIISDAASTVSQSPPPALSTDFSTLISADSTSQINNVLTSVQTPEAAVTATTSNSLSEITPTLTEKVAQITETIDQAALDLNSSFSTNLSGVSYDTITDTKSIRTVTPPETSALSDIASSVGSFASDASNKFVEASMKSVQEILDKTGDSVKANMPELQKALEANTERIIHSVQLAAASAGDQIQNEAAKAVAQGANAVQDGAVSAVNYVGDRTLIDVGKIVFILMQTIGKLILYVLNAILDDLSGTTMADVVHGAKISVETMMNDATNYVTTTINHVGETTIAQSIHNMIYAITEVSKFSFYVLNSVIEFLTGTSASNWAIAASHSIENSANALSTQAVALTNDLTHVSFSQLSASIGDFSHEVGQLILASSNELVHVVGSQVPVDSSTITSAALDSVTAAVQLTNF